MPRCAARAAYDPGVNEDENLRRLRAAIESLEAAGADWRLLDALPPAERERLQRAIAAINNPDCTARRKRQKEVKKARRLEAIRREEEVLHGTGIRELRRKTVFTTPNVFPPKALPQLPNVDAAPGEHHCYVCKQAYTRIHHFYDQLCPSCAELNFFKRTELADLRGRVALLTGGRVKIGYQAGLKLLRCGAGLIVTTRFPRDSAERYAQEPDFERWKDRLEIYGLDLRHTPSVESFCRHILDTRDRLDFIVNNACQTVRRPPEFYEHMMAGEKKALNAP